MFGIRKRGIYEATYLESKGLHAPHYRSASASPPAAHDSLLASDRK